jgi:cysteine desulfurase family protein (TIGR01976 family)
MWMPGPGGLGSDFVQVEWEGSGQPMLVGEISVIDVQSIRDRFPALERTQNGKPVLFFDNPAGTQVPRETIDCYTRYLLTANSNVGGPFATSQETDRVIAAARHQMADFLGAASSNEIVFGQNMTSLTFHLSRAMGEVLQPGDEIVTTRLEHDANVSPWLALKKQGIKVRWIDMHPDDATMDLESAAQVIGKKTRLLAIGYASNAFGTINDVRRLIQMGKSVGALVFVDAVHYAPHGPIDVQELGCDLLACSSYKFFGPHLGILYGRYEVLNALPSQHVRPAGEEPPDSWETGTQSHEALSALIGSLGYIASLGSDQTNPRRRLVEAMTRIHDYERTLTDRLVTGLDAIQGVRVLGITDRGSFDRRVPTASFRVDGLDSYAGARRLGEQGIFSWAGNHYAIEPMERMGLDSTQRVGLVHYNTAAEIDTFLHAVEGLAAAAWPKK